MSVLHPFRYIHERAHHSGPHRERVAKQRRFALWMVITGVARTLGWLLLAVLYICHIPFAVKAFASVSFVALLSAWALVETAWSQAAASWAQLTAGDAHGAAEHTRRELNTDFTAVESDIARLARLQPGTEAEALAVSIQARLGVT